MIPEAKQAYNEVHEAYGSLLLALDKLALATKTTRSPENFAETAFACREMSALLKALRVRADGVGEVAQAAGCATMIRDDVDKVVTDLMSATIDVKQQARLPHHTKDREEYVALMRHLGVPDVLWQDETKERILDLRWPGMKDLISNRVENAMPLPPGIGEPKPMFRLAIRRKPGAQISEH